MSWNKVSGRQAGAADSAPKEVGRGGYLRASVGPLRADDMPDELARALADQHLGNPLGPHELAGSIRSASVRPLRRRFAYSRQRQQSEPHRADFQP
jgi:hypothetical protein